MKTVAPKLLYRWQQAQIVAEAGSMEVAGSTGQMFMREAFSWHYDTPRLQAEVEAEGHVVGHWCIPRVRKAHGLRAQKPRSFIPRTTACSASRPLSPKTGRG